MHDPRIGRFFAVDPLADDYVAYSPYHFSSNQPIHAEELEGLESRNDLNSTTLTTEQRKSVNKAQQTALVDLAKGLSGYEKAKQDAQAQIDAYKSEGIMSSSYVAIKNAHLDEMTDYAHAGGAAAAQKTKPKITKQTSKSVRNSSIRINQKKSVSSIRNSSTVVKPKPGAPLHTYNRKGTFGTAMEDFNNLEGLHNVEPIKDGKFKGYTGVLEGGRTVTVRNGSSGSAPGSESRPTLQINPVRGEKGTKEKFRYGKEFD
jgi:hypothetical protein